MTNTPRTDANLLTEAPIITLTGADEKTDLPALARLDAEIGILYSVERAGTDNRYPRIEWIRDAVKYLPHVALHVCGAPAREELLTHKLDSLLPYVDRVQLNGTFPSAVLQEALHKFPETTFITQVNAAVTTLVNAVVEVESDNHQLLVDYSGGKGVLPERWTAPKTSKRVGFAGGLSHRNIPEQLPLILPLTKEGWWIDMETSLRDEHDNFSVSLAKKAHDAFHTVLSAARTMSKTIQQQHSETVTSLCKDGSAIIKGILDRGEAEAARRMTLLHMAIGFAGETMEYYLAVDMGDEKNMREELGDLEFFLEGLYKDTGVRTAPHALTSNHSTSRSQRRVLIEAGESILDAAKKLVIYNKNPEQDADWKVLLDSARFALDAIYFSTNTDRDQILAENIDKLVGGKNARYKGGAYSDQAAHERRDKAE